MKKNSNLHFLLALGGQKVVILRDDQDFLVYSNCPRNANVSVNRISQAVTAK